MTPTDTSLIVIAVLQILLVFILGVAAILGLPRLRVLADELELALANLRQMLATSDALLREVRESGLIAQAKRALTGAAAAVDRIDPLASDLKATLSGARELLDDATQTSQSVRARVDDLAATQRELTGLATALTDVVSDLRDRELAAKLANVLSDTSLLAADLGILTENANCYLETGRPLVDNLGSVISSARERVGSITHRLSSLKRPPSSSSPDQGAS